MRGSMRASPMSEARPARARRRHARGGVLFAIGLAMLAVLLAVVILGPLIAPYNPAKTSPHSLEGASALHWLGTDSIGRDELSRLIVGGRGTMLITLAAVAIALVAGLVLGLLSGTVG